MQVKENPTIPWTAPLGQKRPTKSQKRPTYTEYFWHTIPWTAPPGRCMGHRAARGQTCWKPRGTGGRHSAFQSTTNSEKSVSEYIYSLKSRNSDFFFPENVCLAAVIVRYNCVPHPHSLYVAHKCLEPFLIRIVWKERTRVLHLFLKKKLGGGAAR